MLYHLLGLLASLSLSLQSPISAPRPTSPSAPFSPTVYNATGVNAEACGEIRRIQAAHGLPSGPVPVANTSIPPHTGPLFIPATLAHDCLVSVPLNKQNSIDFINGFRKYFEFQSTLAWAAQPPPEANGERDQIDLIAGFDKIIANINNGAYKNNYEFEAALRILIKKLRDGHVNWASKCLEGNFGFTHNFPVVQLATDGKQPKIYAGFDWADLQHLKSGVVGISHPQANVSAIETIDDIAVEHYLLDFINREDGGFHDVDARYNSLFTRRSGGNLTPGRFTSSSLVPHSPGFTVKFENGTTHRVNWRASVLGDFSKISSGEDYYAANCIAQPDQHHNDTDAEIPMPPENPAPFVPGYPKPLAKSYMNMISSYLVGPNKEIGVMVLHTFLANDNQTVYQQFVTDTISTFKARGVKKVIIDVTGNGGGNIVLGYDAFKQFFPRENPYATTNLRAHPAAKLFYQLLAEQVSNMTQNGASPEEMADVVSNPFCYSSQLDLEDSPFADWNQAYGPVEVNGGEFTNYLRWNLASDDGFGGEFNVTAGAPGRNTTYQQPWAAEDIILLGDGICSSTCTLFSEAMHNVGVKQAVYGGRPEPGSMQLVGGVAGSQVLSFQSLSSIASTIVEMYPERAEAEGWAEIIPGQLAMPPAGPNAGGINLRNAFRKGSEIPLEYIDTPADHRVTFTHDMFVDISNLWTQVANQAWGI